MRHAAVDELVEPTREREATGRNDGDVATLAGVSQQTVSRVVNAREYVGGHTRERVLSAMRELDYCPNPAAPALGDRSVEDARGHQRRLGRVRAGLRAARTRARRSRVRILRERRPAHLALPRICAHRKVSHIAGARGWPSARRRIEGWRAVLESAEVPVAPPLFGDWSVRSGYEFGRLLALDREVTAIFAANEEMALGVMQAMSEAGREVPRDVSIIGFDDVPFARYLTLPLTTVRQDFEELGQRSVHLLVDAIRGVDDSRVQAAITTELVVRGSTAPAVIRA
jgi:DNA-binding LacI/PurR family transcriptional regulator